MKKQTLFERFKQETEERRKLLKRGKAQLERYRSFSQSLDHDQGVDLELTKGVK